MSHHTPVHKARNWLVNRFYESSSWGAFAVVAISIGSIFSISWLLWVSLGLACAAIVKHDPKRCDCR